MMKTLDLINNAREAFAIPTLAELPKGVPNMVGCCPVANALKEIDPGVKVYHNDIRFSSAEIAFKVGQIWKEPVERAFRVILPDAMQVFIHRFDTGYYPEYEQEEQKKIR